MAEQKSVFMPIDPAAYEGPFSGYLKPTQQQQHAAEAGPPVLAGKGTSLGYLASKFIAGAAQGRIKAFEQRENEKLKNQEVLKNFVQQTVARTDITDQAKQFAMQQYSRVLGADLVNAAGGEGKGKKGKKGSGPSAEPDPTRAEADPTKRGPQGGLLTEHLQAMAKDFGLGLVGGKMPKGAPDINPSTVIGDIVKEISKPQYSIPGIVSQNQQDMERKLKALGPDATREDALAAIMPHLQALDQHAPDTGRQARADLAARFQPAPAPGTPEYYDRRLMNLSGAAQPPAQPPVPAGGAPANATPVAGFSPATPAAATAGPPPAAPQGKTFSPAVWSLMQLAGHASKPQGVEFTGPDGKMNRTFAQFVTSPDGATGWFDQSGRQISAPDVRPASTAEPKQERMGTPARVKGDKAWGGDPKKWYLIRKSEDDPKNVQVLGETNDPNKPRTGAAFNPEQHPNVILANRKIAALEGLNKVIQQTGVPASKNGEPLSGQELAQWYWKAIQDHYQKDASVNKYLPDIRQLLDTMAKSETFKGKQDVVKMMQDASGQAQKDLKDTKRDVQVEHLQGQADDILNSLIGGSGGGDASYDDIIH